MHSRTTIDIREAADVDLEAIAALLNEEIAASPYVYAEVPVTIEDRRAWLSNHQAAGLPVLVAIADDQRVVAWASLSPYRGSSGYRFTAEASVYVASGAQRHGIATQLVSNLVERARLLGLHGLVASIDAENSPSVALFERFGFVECARLPEVGRKFDGWRTQLLFIREV
jgi:phosphinothricin acetyltransferase